MKLKRGLKITFGVIVFFTLPSLLFFSFLYFKYNEELPSGIQGKEADALAKNMLQTLNYEAFQKTRLIEWTFKKRHHYEWDKTQNLCSVYWKEYKVDLDLNNSNNHKAYVHSFNVHGDLADELIQKAIKYFNNDSFWLVAPYKVFDKGTERRLVSLPNNKNGLLVTYTSGGSTPGDSYLWLFNDSGRPVSFKMWTSILPIDGLEASWSDWKTTSTGAQLPNFHKLLFLGLEIDDIKTSY
ncbi:hypothetical protein [Aestuariibaculum suncheonense]|uniref:Uncharacterized protein n=1 Tax=Aestuariibaculum suncheonense TaxID=1028745 RepID=A0A8J6Q4P9_9FLAO|nr:hypothetical protein [Aestuariibaculum suncheonense]MBD0835013.1 hypothetical protein [Aestuariibaculum suncheonense]